MHGMKDKLSGYGRTGVIRRYTVRECGNNRNVNSVLGIEYTKGRNEFASGNGT